MLADVVAYLRCPVCAGPLVAHRATLRCANNHAFDQNRHGHVQLTAKPLTHTGDTTKMMAARATFLAAGHYEPIAAALSSEDASGLVVDVGAGTGYYLAAVLRRHERAVGLAVDAAKPALRFAAKAHPRIGAVACDVWESLPIRDGVAALVLNVFAPRNGPEFRRILRPGGRLVVVTPTARHLAELVGLLKVDPAKDQRLADALKDFALVKRARIENQMSLTGPEVAALIAMGPSAWHGMTPTNAPTATPARAATPVTMSVTVSVYVDRSTSSQPAGAS